MESLPAEDSIDFESLRARRSRKWKAEAVLEEGKAKSKGRCDCSDEIR